MINEKLKFTNDEHKALIKEIISKYLEIKNINEVARITNVTEEVVDAILKTKPWVVKLFGIATWDKVTIMRNKEKEETKDKEYEKIMSNILFYMINSLYNYQEICERVYVGINTFSNMIDNEQYIEEHFGSQMLEKLRDAREIRKRLPITKKIETTCGKIVKDPKYRKLIKPNIIMASPYEHELIKKVSLFLENGGNSEKAAMNSEYCIKEIFTSLCDDKLKDILSENVYEKLQTLIEIDSILTQNRISECKELIKCVVLAVYQEKGNLNRIKDTVGYSEAVIRRVLEHPYVSVLCNRANIEVSVDMLHYEEEKNSNNNYYPIYYYDELGRLVEIDKQEADLTLDIADYIIANKASYSQAAKKFGFSKKTICVKMKDKLPHISKTKSDEVNEIVKGNTPSNIKNSEPLKERTLFESELFMRGYTLTQVAYLVNNSYSSTQRDLSQRLPQISEEKGQLVKTRLQHNQSKIYRK